MTPALRQKLILFLFVVAGIGVGAGLMFMILEAPEGELIEPKTPSLSQASFAPNVGRDEPFSQSRLIQSETILKSLENAPGSDQKQAEEMTTRCLRSFRPTAGSDSSTHRQQEKPSACTRLGIWASQANQKSYSEFRKQALILACEHGTEVFSCSHLYREIHDPDQQRALRVSLDGFCKQGDVRLCTALGRVIATENPKLALEYFTRACERDHAGFGCADLGEAWLTDAASLDTRAKTEQACAEGQLGMCMALITHPDPKGRRVDARAFCKVADGTIWESQACTRAAAIEFEAHDLKSAARDLIAGCGALREDTNQFCRLLSLRVISAGAPQPERIRDAFLQGCTALGFSHDECQLPH